MAVNWRYAINMISIVAITRLCRTVKELREKRRNSSHNVDYTNISFMSDVVRRHLGATPCPSLPGMDNLVRNRNYARQDPVNLDFSL